jgi:hypothetical protein
MFVTIRISPSVTMAASVWMQENGFFYDPAAAIHDRNNRMARPAAIV